MKIRQRTLLNNLFTGILPLLILSLILLFLKRAEENTYLKKNLETYANTFKISLESELEKFRNYTYFISHQNFEFGDFGGKYNIQLSDESMFGNRYNIRMYELFLANTNVYKDIYNWRDTKYSAEQKTIDYLWTHLSQPRYSRRYTTSIPQVVSNVLVFRSCSIIYDNVNYKKIGFSEIVTPLDYDYFEVFAFQDSEIIYFIQTPGGYVFSHPDFNTLNNSELINNLNMKNTKSLPKISMSDKKSYYYYKVPLTQLPDFNSSNQQGPKTWTYIGILYDEQMANKQFYQYQKLFRISILVLVIILSLLAFWYSNNLTRPLRKLEGDISDFDNFHTAIPAPEYIKDEISSIQKSFANMSTHIIQNTATIEKERNRLQIQKEIMESELEMAKNIQNNLLPQKSPHKTIQFYYQAMEQLGGDYFHFTELNKNKTAIFISDVSGHGVPAALITTMLNSFIFQNEDLADKPDKLLHLLNHFLIHQASQNFVTALYGILDTKRLTFDFSIAGHGVPYIIHEGRVACPNVANRGFPLGVLPSNELKLFEKNYCLYQIKLVKGDHLLFTTDGVEECVNFDLHQQQPQKPLEEFGDRAFFHTIHEHYRKKNKDLLRSLKTGLIRFRGQEDFDDDVCMILIDIE